MVDLLGPGDAGAPRALTTTSDVTSPLAGDTWFGDCVNGEQGTGTPIVSKWLNRLLQQSRRLIRASQITQANTDDDLLGQAIQSGGLTYAVAGGTGDAFTATLAPAPIAVQDGMEINVFFGTANTTTSPTLAVNSGFALNILKQNAAAPAAGDVAGPISLIAKAGAWLINGLARSDAATATRAPQVTVLTPSSTSPYTPPVGALYLDVKMLAAGGSGSSNTTGGNAGGNSTFGGSLTCNGGSGGPAGNGTPGTGGTASGGDINTTGGQSGIVFYPASVDYGGGEGGQAAGPIAGPAGQFTGSPAGNNGVAGGKGSGGSGADDNTGTFPSQGGGAGGYLQKLITSLAGSYAFTVGSGGAAVTSGHTSGAGGDGEIVVTAYFQ